MPQFSKHSLDQLATCTAALQILCNQAIRYVDFRVQEGHRNKEAQEDAFARGATQLRWPNGNHNAFPSKAVDLWPFVDGKFIGFPNDPKMTPSQKAACIRYWMYFCGQIRMLADVLFAQGKLPGTIRWGGDWDSDDNLTDQSFNDWPHWEVV